MVEEIHMLETKGLAETNRTSTKNDVNSVEGTSQPTGEEHSNKFIRNSTLNDKPLRVGMDSW